jgi:hypothetical protein
VTRRERALHCRYNAARLGQNCEVGCLLTPVGARWECLLFGGGGKWGCRWLPGIVHCGGEIQQSSRGGATTICRGFLSCTLVAAATYVRKDSGSN